MPRQTIYDHTKFEMKDYYYNKRGFKWFYDIQLSVQVRNTKGILYEIIEMCNVMNYELYICIELQSNCTLDITVKNEGGNNELTCKMNKNPEPTVNKSDRLLYNRWGGFYR
jgi:hypothetical protein